MTDSQPVESKSGLPSAKVMIGAAAAVLLVVFFLQNTEDVTVNILWIDWETQMVWALVVAAVLGAITAFFFSFMRGRSRANR
jgi:uncharacterized integral membrane protein